MYLSDPLKMLKFARKFDQKSKNWKYKKQNIFNWTSELYNFSPFMLFVLYIGYIGRWTRVGDRGRERKKKKKKKCLTAKNR